MVLTLVKTVFKLPTSFAKPLISPIALFTLPIWETTLSNDSFSLPSKVFSNFSETVTLILSNLSLESFLIWVKFSLTVPSNLSKVFSKSSFNSLIPKDNWEIIFSLESLLSLITLE